MAKPELFEDRADAGRRLGAALAGTVEPPAVVLGVARGGVIVGAEVARALGAPLDVVIPRKLGAPGNPELGIGAVAPGVRVVDRGIMRALGVDDAYIEREARRQEAEIDRRTAAYRQGSPPADVRGATAVVVDDGVATGVTAVAALRWARAQGAASVIMAAPVGPAGVERRLAAECDRCVVLLTPRNLRAVGQWYERFDQTTDIEVRDALRAASGGR
ncbi:MAG TPA: phosphoribosyltransferase family protein [Actinomycetota bacterium]|nr:phosphoribosyltransferase family protein [Actinomycetota bacterium]